MGTIAADRQPLQQGHPSAGRTLTSFDLFSKTCRILAQPLLVGQILLPGDVSRVDITLEVDPFFHRFAHKTGILMPRLAARGV